MKNVEIIVITLFVLAAAFFAFLYWVELAAKKKFREMFHAAEHKARMYAHAFEMHAEQHKMFVVTGAGQLNGPEEIKMLDPGEGSTLMRVMQQCSALEVENAGLRSDVETGCKIIDEQRHAITIQKNVVNNLRRQMAQDRNQIMRDNRGKKR